MCDNEPHTNIHLLYDFQKRQRMNSNHFDYPSPPSSFDNELLHIINYYDVENQLITQ